MNNLMRQAADSLVVSHLTGTMQEQSKFGGFTYVGDEKLKLSDMSVLEIHSFWEFSRR